MKLVLGGTGFIGSELVKQLAECNQGEEIIILTQNRNPDTTLGDRIIEMPYNFENINKIISAYRFDSIFLFNGNPHPSFSINQPWIDSTLTLIPLQSILESLKRNKFKGKVWYMSSVAVYGNSPTEILSESQLLNPISPYGLAKQSAELYCKFYANQYNLKIGILRLFSTYGPGLKRQVIFDIYKKLKANPPYLELLSRNGDARDMSFVEDMAQSILKLNSFVVPDGDIINIGSGYSTEIFKIAELIGQQLNYKGQILFSEKRQIYDGKNWIADITKIKKLNIKHKTRIEEGIKKTIELWEKDSISK